MKKILLAIAAVALLFATSCKKEQSINPAVDVPEGSFLATIDNGANPQNAPAVKDGMGTMTTIDANRYVIWENGDQISINGSAYTTTSTPGNTVVFSGGNATGTTFHAFYPVSIAGTDAAGTLPATQTIELDGNNNITVRNLPMYAISTNNQLTFHNICAALKVHVPIACDSIVVSAHQPICGNFTITYDETKPYADMTNASASDTIITVVKEQSGSFAADEIAYVAIPAGTYTNFTVKFYAGSSLVGQKSLASLPVEVNNVYNLNIPMELCFTALAQTNISMSAVHSVATSTDPFPNIYLEYCKYDCNEKTYSPWNKFIDPNTAAATVSLDAGDKLYLRAGDGTATIRTNTCLGYKGIKGYIYYKFTSTDDVKVSGNIMYLLSKTPSTTLPQTQGGIFAYLFRDMNKLKDAKDLVLPAAILRDRCYYGMFLSCTTLTTAPTLPATTLDVYCYGNMFKDCEELTTAPSLPATTLAESSCEGMFWGCSKLKTAPILHAATLETKCYYNMFRSCSDLTEVTMLATTISSSAQDMLNNWLSYAGTNVSGTKTVNIESTLSNTTGTVGATITANTPSDWTISNGTNSWAGEKLLQ